MSIATPDDLHSLTSPCPASSAGVLVVDPDPAFAVGMKTFLREYVGFDRVFTACGGEDALRILEQCPDIEVVTLAYEMPGLDGLELMERLSQGSRQRPLAAVMITGHPSRELEDRFRSFAGPKLLARHFLPKPVEFDRIEPLVLRAHEEVQVAKEVLLREILAEREANKRAAGGAGEASEELAAASVANDAEAATAAADEPFSGEPAEWERLIRMEADLARHETKLDRIYGEVRKVKRSVRRSFWSLLLGALLVWATVHYGWHREFAPAAEKAKAWTLDAWDRLSTALPWSAEEPGAGAAGAEEPAEAEEPEASEAAPPADEPEPADEPAAETPTEHAEPTEPTEPEPSPSIEIRQGVPL